MSSNDEQWKNVRGGRPIFPSSRMNQFFSIIPPRFLSNGENFIWSFFQDRVIRYFETALSGMGMKFVSSENSRITWKLSESSGEINKILRLGALENYAVRYLLPKLLELRFTKRVNG